MEFDPYAAYGDTPTKKAKTVAKPAKGMEFDPYAAYGDEEPAATAKASIDEPVVKANLDEIFNDPSFQAMSKEDAIKFLTPIAKQLGLSEVQQDIVNPGTAARFGAPVEKITRDLGAESLYDSYVNNPETQKRLEQRGNLEFTSPYVSGPASLFGNENAQQQENMLAELRRTTPDTGKNTLLSLGGNAVAAAMVPLGAGAKLVGKAAGAVLPAAKIAAEKAAIGLGKLGVAKQAALNTGKEAAVAGGETFITQGAEQRPGETFKDVLKKRAEGALTASGIVGGIGAAGRTGLAVANITPSVDKAIAQNVGQTAGLDTTKLMSAADIRAGQARAADILAQRAAIAEKSGVALTPAEITAATGTPEQRAAAIKGSTEAAARGGKTLQEDMRLFNIDRGEAAAKGLGISSAPADQAVATVRQGLENVPTAVGTAEDLAKQAGDITSDVGAKTFQPESVIAGDVQAATDAIKDKVRQAYVVRDEALAKVPFDAATLPKLPTGLTTEESTTLLNSPTVKSLIDPNTVKDTSLVGIRQKIDKIDREIDTLTDRTLGASTSVEVVRNGLGKYRDQLQNMYDTQVDTLPTNLKTAIQSADEIYAKERASQRTIGGAGNTEINSVANTLESVLANPKASIATLGEKVFSPKNAPDAVAQVEALRKYINTSGAENVGGLPVDEALSSLLLKEVERKAGGDIDKLAALASDNTKYGAYFDAIPQAKETLANHIASKKMAIASIKTEAQRLLPSRLEPVSLSVSQPFAKTAAKAVSEIKGIKGRLNALDTEPTKLVTEMSTNPDMADDFLAFTAKQNPKEVAKIRQAVREIYMESVQKSMNVIPGPKPYVTFDAPITVINGANKASLTKLLGNDFVDKLEAVQEASQIASSAKRTTKAGADIGSIQATAQVSRIASLFAGAAAAVSTATTGLFDLAYGRTYSKKFMDAMTKDDAYLRVLGDENTVGTLEKLNNRTLSNRRRILKDYSNHVLVGQAARNALPEDKK